MKRPTSNPISQTAHLTSQAVDYSARPDSTFYAPEAGRIESYQVAGECGNNLKLRSGNKIHSFCHLERNLVSPGQDVNSGQPIGIMGYTGRTDPPAPDPNGKHLHHFIRFDDGRYIYPPSLVNEPFGSGEEDMTNRGDVVNLYKKLLGRDPSENEIKIYVDRPFKDVIYGFISSDEFKRLAPYETANIYAQALLFRDMTKDEWDKYHKSKTRDQLFDDFRSAPERGDNLKKLIESDNKDLDEESLKLKQALKEFLK